MMQAGRFFWGDIIPKTLVFLLCVSWGMPWVVHAQDPVNAYEAPDLQCMTLEEYEKDFPAAVVENECADKLIYSMRDDSDPVRLEEDCKMRGGTFNACASPCDSPLMVCVYACENIGRPEIQKPSPGDHEMRPLSKRHNGTP